LERIAATEARNWALTYDSGVLVGTPLSGATCSRIHPKSCPAAQHERKISFQWNG